MAGQQLRILEIQHFSDSDPDALMDAVESFLGGGGDESVSPSPESEEATLIDWEYQVDGGTHHIVLIYTE